MQRIKLQHEKDLLQDVDAQAVQVEEELLVEEQQDVLQEDQLQEEEGDKLLSKFFSINFVMCC